MCAGTTCFSALQRAEIAEITRTIAEARRNEGFSALQRAEIAEIPLVRARHINDGGFSALQRAEIAEIHYARDKLPELVAVSVLFNEPKLLKSASARCRCGQRACFSALQRAEIAEIATQQA